MNKTDNTKQVWHGILLLKCLHLPKQAQQQLNYQRHQLTSKQLLYKLCFTVEQRLIHETAGLFQLKSRGKTVLYFCKLFKEGDKSLLRMCPAFVYRGLHWKRTSRFQSYNWPYTRAMFIFHMRRWGVNGKYLYRIRKGFNKFATFMKPNPPFSKLLKHIKQQENTERILCQQSCPKSAFVRYSLQQASIKSICAVVCYDVFYIQVNVLFILRF
jgi:hypothetical protein